LNTLLIVSLQFISSRGNEYFCEIDEEYLTDRFNLTGLNTEVQYYQYALDLVTDVFDLDCDDEMRESIEKSARHLYGLVHARYIVTTRGLAKMVCLHIYNQLICLKANLKTAREVQEE
jgi:casein kinase II subunit beta